MSEPQTCGKGLAERAALPAHLGELTSAMAEILSYHQKSLDAKDENARNELREYDRLAQAYRAIAAQLKSVADTMAGERGLPMAPHDFSMLASAENAAIFAKFVDAQRHLLQYLDASIARDRMMLEQMRNAGRHM